MKIAVIGSGAREHAIAWKLAQSDKVRNVYVIPGNGGTAMEKKCGNLLMHADPVSAEGQDALIAFARQEGIALTVVGPETPLAAGIVDRFRNAGLAIVGPDKAAARLESSKVFSKSFMEKYGVRSAQSSSFSDHAAAIGYAKEHFQQRRKAPLVIKADGLAAGKGVIIAQDYAEAEAAINSFIKDRLLGDAGKTVVLEDFLPGKEISILAAVSAVKGKPGVIRPFVPARDHKRRFENGRGPNTGGMGAIAPVPDFSDPAQEDFLHSILKPTLQGIEQEGLDYRGFIFFGCMVKDDRCFLLEYNVRLGDPETQAVLPLMDFDLAALCFSLLDGTLAQFPLKWKEGGVCAPVAVASGYPGSYQKGDRITIDQETFSKTGAELFIAGAGTKTGAPGLYTSGGRVLTISAGGINADDAWEKAYQAMAAVTFNGMAYRKDIGRE